MKKCIIFLMTISIAIAIECDICLRQKCLTATYLDTGLENDFTGILARFTTIDPKNNILYIVRDKSTYALNLDNNNRNVVPTVRANETPSYFTVDQVTGDIYYSYGRYSSLYRYKPKSNETEVINQTTSELMWAYNGTVYWYALEKELYFITGSSPKQSVAAMKGVRVKDIAFDKHGNLYAANRNTVYKIKENEEKTVVASGSYELATDGNGDVYLISTREFKIYQVNLETDQLSIVGSLSQRNNYVKFMFDKYNNIISKKLLAVNDWYCFKESAEQGKCTNEELF